jgi:hypothetical protein
VGIPDGTRALDGPDDRPRGGAALSEETANPSHQAGVVLRDEPGELALLRLTNEIRVPRLRDRHMSVGVQVHAHSTRGHATIFPLMERDYSQTPLPQKLGIKEGSRVGLQRAPEGFAETIAVSPRTRGKLDVVVLFATRKGELIRHFPVLARRLEPDGGLWVVWPKKAAQVETDLSFETVQKVGLDAGLVDNKSCSVDETWQALRFVYRLADRPASSSKRSA